MFIEPKLNKDFAHYVIRRSIIQSINKYLPGFYGIVVDLGCGNMPYRETILSNNKVEKYIGIDWPGTSYYSNKPDFIWDGITIPLENNSVDFVLLTEVMEHLDDPLAVVNEIYRILKPGGSLVGTTPFFWLLHEVPNDMQRLSPFGIKRIFEKTGFERHEIIGAGGWRTSLAQFITMYIGFGISKKFIQKMLKVIFYYPVLYLTRKDHEVTEFRHAGMINSISFWAVK